MHVSCQSFKLVMREKNAPHPLFRTVSRLSFQVALSLETYGLTVEAQQMYLDLIAREQNGAGTAHVSQDELETWEVSWADLD